MAYASRDESPYHVLVRYQKASGLWETFKYRGEHVVCYASGGTYAHAMIQTTLAGLAPDEPAAILDTPRHDMLGSVAVGSRIDQLFDHFPELHAHRWATGEVLYEACNHATQEVFTFIEEPQSRGYVTTVWVRQAEDPSVCRDEKGELPQIDTPAVTPEGVKVGDPAAAVIERYGEPARVEHNVPDTELLVYELSSPAVSRAMNLLLSFLVSEDHVRGFMLQGDVRGKVQSQPRSEAVWRRFESALAEALANLGEDGSLVISHTASNASVRFAGGTNAMRAEAVSNTSLPDDAQLLPSACDGLLKLGWNPPTYIPVKGLAQPADGSSNFYIDAATPVPHAQLAGIAVASLRGAYRVRHPGELEYAAYGHHAATIRLPGLKNSVVEQELDEADRIFQELEKDNAPGWEPPPDDGTTTEVIMVPKIPKRP